MDGMKLTLQLQLLPEADQAAALRDVMAAFNAAATHAARVGFRAGAFSQPSIHKLCYAELRERFGLSAQLAVRAIGKAVDVFRTSKARAPSFRPDGAITYDERCFSFKGPAAASILTRSGRMIVPMIYGQYQRERFDRIKGQVDLVERDGRFYLHATIDVPEDAPIDVSEFLGVDLGVVNLATTSDGQAFSGETIEKVRGRLFRTRRSLGRKTSHRKKRRTRKNARRAQKRLGRKEARFRKHENHCIAKALVMRAKDTGRGIALEDLTGILGRTRFRKRQRAKIGGWAFFQLRSYVTYKAQLHGVPVVLVDSRNTSRTCHRCGHCDKANRRSQSKFCCRACGHTAHADCNAAQNIAARGAEVMRPEVSQPPQSIAA